MRGAGRGKKSRAAEGAECANVLVTHDLSASSRTHGGRKELTHGSLLSLKRAVSHTHTCTHAWAQEHIVSHTQKEEAEWLSHGGQKGGRKGPRTRHRLPRICS